MMAEKARLFQDEEMSQQIIDASNPKDMKAYGRLVQNSDKDIWEKNCQQIVKTANMAKFSQNEDILMYLLETESYILVEVSPRDQIWGIAMSRSPPDWKPL